MHRTLPSRLFVLVVCLFVDSPGPSAVAASAGAPPGAKARAVATRPLGFEPNVGQVDPRVRFLARGSGGAVFLGDREAVLSVYDAPEPGRDSRQVSGTSGYALRLRFEHAAPGSTGAGERPMAGKSNYLRGPDPDKWVRGVATYEAVRYPRLYEEVDAVFGAAEGRLDCRFELAPGADLRQIRLRFEGQESAAIAADGALVLRVGGREARQERPTVEQAGREVDARWLVGSDGSIALEADGVDPGRALVVAAALSFGRESRSAFGDYWTDNIVVDPSGAAYIEGYTHFPTYPTTPGAFDTTFNGGDADAFVTKISPDGATVVYSTLIGGTGIDRPNAIAVDGTGAAVLVGYMDNLGGFGSGFPTTPGAYNPEERQGQDGFVTRLAPDGASLVFSTYLGGSPAETIRSVAIAPSGAVVVSGVADWELFSGGERFPTTPGAYLSTPPVSGRYAFVTSFNADGSALVYSTLVGQADVQDMALDSSGAVYITGSVLDPNYPTTPGAFDTTLDTDGDLGGDAFVTRLNSIGSALLYSTFVGGDLGDEALSIAVDAAGSAYVVGRTVSSDYPTTAGAFDTAYGGAVDGMVTKLSPNGSSLAYSTFVGHAGFDTTEAVAVGAAGTVFVAGFTDSPLFPTTPGAYDTTFSGTTLGDNDGFLLKLNASGSAPVFSTLLGGYGSEFTYSVAVDSQGAAYLAGATTSPDFPVVVGGQPARRGPGDLHVTKVAPSGASLVYSWLLGGDSSPGPGDETPGVYIPATGAFFLRNQNAPGPADLTFVFGPGGAGLTPLSGDWDGDGDDTVGLYHPPTGIFYLRDENAPGPADRTVGFGPAGPGLVPIVGDWDGDGDDTVGLYVPSTGAFFLRNANSPGPADVTFLFGPGGGQLTPVAGDWNRDGADTVGLYDPASGAFFLRNDNDSGPADATFVYGSGGATPLAGDWNGDAWHAIGIYAGASGTWFVRNFVTAGPAHLTYSYGPAGVTPLAGDWDGN